MIRQPKTDSLKINVILETGEMFIAKDIPPKPFGENERMVSFWQDDRIMIIPMERVHKIELYEEIP